MVNHPFRDTFLTKHHIRPKIRGGILSPDNTLKIWYDKHQAYHRLFGTLVLDEIISWLKRDVYYSVQDWTIVFGSKTPVEAVSLLIRVRRIKRSLKHRQKAQDNHQAQEFCTICNQKVNGLPCGQAECIW